MRLRISVTVLACSSHCARVLRNSSQYCCFSRLSASSNCSAPKRSYFACLCCRRDPQVLSAVALLLDMGEFVYVEVPTNKMCYVSRISHACGFLLHAAFFSAACYDIQTKVRTVHWRCRIFCYSILLHTLDFIGQPRRQTGQPFA